jgi:hypothetical protein
VGSYAIRKQNFGGGGAYFTCNARRLQYGVNVVGLFLEALVGSPNIHLEEILLAFTCNKFLLESHPCSYMGGYTYSEGGVLFIFRFVKIQTTTSQGY